MNGYDIYKKAVLRAGLSSESISQEDVSERAQEFINQISADLKLVPISSIYDEINCSDDIAEALCCGVAMLLTLSIADMEKNRIYTDIYNSKRAAVLCDKSAVEDVMPSPSYGGD